MTKTTQRIIGAPARPPTDYRRIILKQARRLHDLGITPQRAAVRAVSKALDSEPDPTADMVFERFGAEALATYIRPFRGGAR